MTERIDIALDPNVLAFVGLMLTLISLLIGTVVYPYLRSNSSTETAEVSAAPEGPESVEDMIDEEEPLERRVEEFQAQMHERN